MAPATWPPGSRRPLAGVADEPALQRALRRVPPPGDDAHHLARPRRAGRRSTETLEDLSELADCCIRARPGRGSRLDPRRTRAPRATPRAGAQRLLVIGMGKLGARELNLSSDIDLIFAFPAQGQVSGGPRPLTNQQFFVRLAQRLVQALDNQTVDGFVFRVDTRLRPFGDVGPPGHELRRAWRTTTSPRRGSGSATP